MKESKVSKAYSDFQVSVWETEHLELPAAIALDLIKTNGFLTGCPDGEDSQGRAQMKLLPEDELVSRAFKIGELFMEAARSKGYTMIAHSLFDKESVNNKDV